MVENILLSLKSTREEIIARQLGEHVAQRPLAAPAKVARPAPRSKKTR
jgi:hypothetical protein